MAIFISSGESTPAFNSTISGSAGILLFEALEDFDALISLCNESRDLGLAHIAQWLPDFDDWLSWFRSRSTDRISQRSSEFPVEAVASKHPRNLSPIEGFEWAVRWARDIYADAFELDYLHFFASIATAPEGLSYAGESPALVLSEGSINLAVTPAVAGGFFLQLGGWVVAICVKALLLPTVQGQAITTELRRAAQAKAVYSNIVDLRMVDSLEKHSGVIVLIHGLFSTDLLTFDGLIEAWRTAPELERWGQSTYGWGFYEMTNHLSGLWADSTKQQYIASAFERSLQDYCIAGLPHDTLTNIQNNAIELASCLIKLNPKCPVVFVCHSRGGLVARKAISILQGREAEDWNGRIKLCVTFGTPHSGAALAQHPLTLVAAYSAIMAKTRTAVSLARVLAAYRSKGAFEGIDDLKPDSSFLSDLRIAEIKSASSDSSAPRILRPVGSSYSGGQQIKRNVISLLLRDAEHDLIVPMKSSLPDFLNDGLRTTCAHGDYFSKEELVKEHFKEVIHSIREALGLKDRVIALSKPDE